MGKSKNFFQYMSIKATNDFPTPPPSVVEELVSKDFREIYIETDSALWQREDGLLELVYCAADSAMAFFMENQQQRYDDTNRQRWSLSILCTHDRRMREFNRRFRAKDSICSSLAFSADNETYEHDMDNGSASYTSRHLGDIALGYRAMQREVERYDLDKRAHCAHITVHAVAHLVGLKHETAQQLQFMEAREEEILRRLGFPNSNPYGEAKFESQGSPQPQQPVNLQ